MKKMNMKKMLLKSLKLFSGMMTAAIIFTAAFNITASAQATHTFSSNTQIQIQGFGAANPYPSGVNVSGIQTSATSRFRVKLKGFTHNFPDDVGVLLVAPNGRKVRIFTDCLGGEGGGVSNIDLTFDDLAPNPLPDNPSGPTPSGTYQPKEGTTTVSSGSMHPASFESPAPSGPYTDTLTSLNGINPNGTWQLFVDDDTADDGGTISGGWELLFQTNPTAASSVISGVISGLPPGGGQLGGVSVRLTLTDSSGGETIVYSDANGSYQFPPMPSGQTYILTPWSKTRRFTPTSQVISLTEDTTVNFSVQ